MSTPTDRLPTLIVTGPLGAGKTRFISGLVAGEGATDTAILVNEFADVGIDQDIFETYGLSAVSLTGGCICCALRGEVRRTLQTLLFARARGEVTPFVRVIVETSGLADPAPLIAEFLEDAVLRRRFRLGGVITLVDAMASPPALAADSVAARQIALADRLVISKLDIAADDLGPMTAYLRAANPAAIIASNADDAPLLNDLLGGRDEGFLYRGATKTDGQAADHSAALRSYYVEAEEAACSRGLFSFVEALADACGESLLRLKGIAALDDGSKRTVLVDVVRGRLYPAEIAGKRSTGSERPRAVAIVQHVDGRVVREAAAAHGLRCT